VLHWPNNDGTADVLNIHCSPAKKGVAVLLLLLLLLQLLL